MVLIVAVAGSAASDWWGTRVGQLGGHQTTADALIGVIAGAAPALLVLLGTRLAKGPKLVSRVGGAGLVWAVATQPYGARYFMPVFPNSRLHVPGYLPGLAFGIAIAFLLLIVGWNGFVKRGQVDG